MALESTGSWAAQNSSWLTPVTCSARAAPLWLRAALTTKDSMAEMTATCSLPVSPVSSSAATARSMPRRAFGPSRGRVWSTSGSHGWVV